MSMNTAGLNDRPKLDASRPEPKLKDEQDSPITSVARAFGILELLASPDGPKSLSDIAREAGLAPSSAHRFLKALTALGFVSQDAQTSLYRATLKLFNLGSTVLSQFHFTERLLPLMRKVAEEVEESVSLVFREGPDGVLLDRVEGRQGVQVFAKYRRNPLYCTAAGKAILACFSEENLTAYLKQTALKGRTQFTITSAADLRREVERIRRDGFAIDNQELEMGAMCVAVPVKVTPDLLAAVSVSALAPRMTDKRMRDIAAALNKAVVAAGMGFYESQRRPPAASNGKRRAGVP